MELKIVLKKGTCDFVLKARMKISETVLLCEIKKWALVALLLIPLLFIQTFSSTSDPEKVEVFEQHICKTV